MDINICVQGYVEKLQIELQKCQENYLDAVDKNSTLERELKEAKTKIMLLEKEGPGILNYIKLLSNNSNNEYDKIFIILFVVNCKIKYKCCKFIYCVVCV